LLCALLLQLLRPPPTSPLFPYTTLFRSAPPLSGGLSHPRSPRRRAVARRHRERGGARAPGRRRRSCGRSWARAPAARAPRRVLHDEELDQHVEVEADPDRNEDEALVEPDDQEDEEEQGRQQHEREQEAHAVTRLEPLHHVDLGFFREVRKPVRPRIEARRAWIRAHEARPLLRTNR